MSSSPASNPKNPNPAQTPTPQWLRERAEWARPTGDRAALRRARARAAWNRKRQEAAERRRRDLLALWQELGPVPMTVLFRHYRERIWAAACPSTFWKDVRVLRERARNFAAVVGQPPAQRLRLSARSRTHGGVWMARCLALKLAVHRVLAGHPELLQAVEQLAFRYARTLSLVPGAAECFTTTTTTTGATGTTGATTPGATLSTGATIGAGATLRPVSQPRPQPQPQADWWEAWARAGARAWEWDDPWS